MKFVFALAITSVAFTACKPVSRSNVSSTQPRLAVEQSTEASTQEIIDRLESLLKDYKQLKQSIGGAGGIYVLSLDKHFEPAIEAMKEFQSTKIEVKRRKARSHLSAILVRLRLLSDKVPSEASIIKQMMSEINEIVFAIPVGE